MFQSRNAIVAISLILSALPGRLPAQGRLESAGSDVPEAMVAKAFRAAPAPKLDGLLDDPIWRTATAISGFVQRDPNEGKPGTEPTEVRVAYTDDALWIAVRAGDSRAGEISALLSRRDVWSPSDEVTVMVDSYHDRRTAYAFTVNAAGVKRDSYYYADGDRDDGWDAVWDAKVSVDAQGWSAEFRIPFSQIRFAKATSHVFGFNVTRRINRLNETQYWKLIPKNASGFVSLFGDLVQVDGVSPARHAEVLPYTAASARNQPGEPGNPFQTGRTRTATAGGDFKVGVSSAMTLTGTINPDFGQVEADPAVVNLSAFETFYPERRPFFTEGSDLFRFRIADGDGDGSSEELFYTRRIGRAPHGAADPRGGYAESIDRTTILGAAKLTGRTPSGWSVGFLSALTDREDARAIDGTGRNYLDAVEPRTFYGAGRVEKALRRGQTVIGLFGTAVERDLPTNLQYLHSSAHTGGLSWSHRFARNSYEFSGRIVGSLVNGSKEALLLTQESSARYFQRPDADYVSVDSNRTSLSGYTVAANGGKTAGRWRWNLNFQARSPGFEVNDVGYMQQTDWVSQSVWVNRRWLTPGKVFRRFNLNGNQWSSFSYGGDRRNLGGNVNLNFTTLNFWNGYAGFNRNWGGLNPAQLRGGPSLRTAPAWNGWYGFQTDERKSVRAGINGWWYREDQTGSWATGLGVNATLRLASNADVMLAPNLNRNHDQDQYLATITGPGGPAYLFGELNQTTVSMTLRSNVVFSPGLSLQLYAQPFVSSGRFGTTRQVAAPRATRYADRFSTLGTDRASRNAAGELVVDLDANGTPEANLGDPDFTVLSFRSNVVLRWEYSLGSTLFLVWQHGRSGFDADGRFRFGSRLGELFRAAADNTVLVKLNYWLSL